MDFMNLAEVPEVDSVQDGDTVFVVRDGEVRRVAKDKVGGGAGGYLLEIPNEDIQQTEGGIYVTTNIDEMLAVANAGGNVAIKADVGCLMGRGAAGYSVICHGEFSCGPYIEAEGLAATMTLIGFELFALFTNGQPITEAAPTSLTALSSKLGGGTNAVV